MARSGRLLGRRLLVGGAFYVVYLGIVGVSLAGVFSTRPGRSPRAVEGPCYTRPTVPTADPAALRAADRAGASAC